MLKLTTMTLPHVGLDKNARSVSFTVRGLNAPNFNTPFKCPCEGLEPQQVRWLIEAENRRPEDPVIYYLHGGGYALGAFPTMPLMLLNLWKRVNNRRLSIIWLDYSLTSTACYPKQVNETIALYNELQKSCVNIILMGDSSGGHMIQLLLRHALHTPLPAGGKDGKECVIPLINIGRTTTAILLSPWVHMGDDSDEALWAEAFLRYDRQFLHSDIMNPYKDGLEWDLLLPPYTYVAYGAVERARPAIEQWLELAHVPPEFLYVEPKGDHDSLAVYGPASSIMGSLVEFIRNYVPNAQVQSEEDAVRL